MIDSFIMVGQQVLHLFAIVAVGYILGKASMLSDKASAGMSNLMIYVVSPCMLVVAFQRPLESASFRNFCLAIPVAVAIHLINIAVAQLAIRDSDLPRRQALRFSTVLSNCGFMAYPLQTALLGTIGVFYGSAYVLVFTVVAWTYGLYLMSGQRGQFSWRPLILNPGIISSVVAIGLYLLRLSLPELILTPVTYLSSLNTPLPMVIVGYQLSQADIRMALKGASMWISMGLRLVVLPLVALGLCLAMRLDSQVLIAMMAATAAPPAALLSMLSARFGRDTSLASSVVATQTLFSVLTMPIVVGLAQYLVS